MVIRISPHGYTAFVVLKEDITPHDRTILIDELQHELKHALEGRPLYTTNLELPDSPIREECIEVNLHSMAQIEGLYEGVFSEDGHPYVSRLILATLVMAGRAPLCQENTTEMQGGITEYNGIFRLVWAATQSEGLDFPQFLRFFERLLRPLS